jgi:hypothetical protein
MIFALFCFVLFCFVLFCFVLFCFVLYCIILFCFVLLCFVLYYFDLFCDIPSCVFVTAMLIQNEYIFQLTPVLQNTIQNANTTTIEEETRR